MPLPKRYEETRIIRCSVDKVFSVVADVDRYSEFVPWCVMSSVNKKRLDSVDIKWLSEHPTGMVFYGDLAIGFGVLNEKYESRVWLIPNQHLEAEATNLTLFKRLKAIWEFSPLTDESGEACVLKISVDFEFHSYIYAYVANVMFEELNKRMVAAFENRCIELYGASPKPTTTLA